MLKKTILTMGLPPEFLCVSQPQSRFAYPHQCANAETLRVCRKNGLHFHFDFGQPHPWLCTLILSESEIEHNFHKKKIQKIKFIFL